ncbi:regulator of protease activity HflC (stomatin/prohibitin superfamily) [Sphingomonas trueperi]|uniref:prohibitin family protein n=1 Tax=Sphingomonas trueperi TaxID=53317 RepID=UPI003393ADA7
MKKFAALVILAAPLAACGSVDAGKVGLWNNYGKIGDQVLQGGGLQWYNPLTTSLEEMDVQEQPWKANTSIYTKDLQTATVTFTITTSLDPQRAVNMRRTVGLEWRDKLIPPVVAAVVKNVFGQFNAPDAVARRGDMQTIMLDQLRQKFAQRGIIVNDFSLTNIDYSDAFEGAVEAAQVATQKAIAAKNHTVEVEEQAKQRVITANSEAEAIKVQAVAISSNPAIVQLRAIEKWNGEMPQNMYGSAPMPFVQGK